MKLFQILLAMIAISCVGMRAAETGPRSCPRLPSLAPEEKLQLQTDGKAFMVRLSMGEYESAFSELFAKYAEPGRSAEADARKWTYDMGYLSEELQARCGDAIPGSFTFVGSLTAGGRILNLAYLLRHAWRPFPVVLDFSKIEDRWAMVQISTDPELSMEVMREFWTTVDPAYLTQRVPEAQSMLSATEACMAKWHAGNVRPGFAQLVDQFGKGIPEKLTIEVTESIVLCVERRPSWRLGDSQGFELWDTSHMANDLLRITYVWFFAKKNSPVTFIFYRGEHEWSLFTVRLFDDARPDLKDSMTSSRVPLRPRAKGDLHPDATK